MKPLFILATVITLAFALLCITNAFGEVSIGLGLSQSDGDGFGANLTGEYETETLDIELTAQGVEYYDIKLSPSYRHSFGWIDASVFTEHDFTGFSLGNLNMKNDVGVSGILPIQDLDLELALFYRLGNVAGAEPLLHEGEQVYTAKGEPIFLKAGLTPVAGGFPNIAFATQFDVRDFEVEAKALTNITSNKDAITPQWLVEAQTSGDVYILQWVLSLSYAGQHIKLADAATRTIEQSLSGSLTFGLDW